MFHLLHELIFGNETVRFESRYALQESVRRLNAAITPPPASLTITLLGLPNEHVEGAATVQHVWISRTTGKNESLRPLFTGSFGMENGRVFLAGEYALPVATRWFLAVVFGALFSATGVLAALALWGNVEFIAPLYSLGIIGLLMLALALNRLLGRSDMSTINELVRKTLEY
jgi:hypothetical protein